jgi:hypothetical protein
MSETGELILQNSTPKKAAFLAAYSRCGCVSQAADASGASRDSHYKWMRSDPDYPEAFQKAQRQANDFLFRVARKRATKGWLEPVFHEGVVCGHKRKFSDVLLIFLMKGEQPEKYRDTHSVELSGQVVQIDWSQFVALSDKQALEVEAKRVEQKEGTGAGT